MWRLPEGILSSANCNISEKGTGRRMLKRKLHITRVVLWGWILSYMAVMIVPLLFGAIIYMYALGTIRDEIQTLQQQAFVQVKYNLENMLENLYKVSYALSSSAYNSGIYVKREDGSGQRSMSMAQVQKTMGSYGIANNNIKGIYMYFPENDYLLTGTLTYKYERLREHSERFLGLTENEFMSICQDDSSSLKIIGADSENQQLYYVYKGREFKGNIIVFMPLNMDVLRDMTKIDNTGVFLLLGGKRLWLGGMAADVPEAFPELSLGQDMDSRKVDSVYWMGQALDSREDYLATCIDGDNYFGKIVGMRRILFAYLAVSMVLGGVGTWFFSRRHYTPVEKLMEGVEQSYDRGESEYKIITDYYASMKNQYETSRQELKESREDIRDSRLTRLLRGSNEKFSYDLWRKLDADGVFLKGSYLLAGVLMHDEERGRWPAAAGDKGSGTERGDYQLNRFIVDNILTEVLSNKYTVISGEVDGFLVYLIHFGDMPEDMDRLTQNIEYAIYYIEQFFHIHLTVNLSRVSEDIRRIGNAFDEVKLLQEYRDWAETDDIRIRTASKLYFPEEDELESVNHYNKYNEMVRLMKSGDYEKVDAILKELLGKADASEHRPAGTARKDRMVREIVDYIENHYDDWQLSGKMFAEQYQVSLSYLSQIFKKEKGVGLLDYINQIRYTKAKAMIESGATIQEAARRAGYATAQPLRRLFRQFEGVTPSQSRKKKED